MSAFDGIGPDSIHSYWHDDDIPAIVAAAVRSMEKHNPSRRVHMWNAKTVVSILGDDKPGNFATMPELRKADWIRIVLLAKHGGVWLDATCFVTEPLECWVVPGLVSGWGAPANPEVMENWAFAAPPADPLIIAWRDEFRTALEAGDRYWRKMQQIKAVMARVVHIDLPYLMMHFCLQVTSSAGCAAVGVVTASDDYSQLL